MTATIKTADKIIWPSRPVFWRFVWKEFRMLRGLWLAVAIMGLVVQCAERLLLPYSIDFPLTLLNTALAAAVLYAAGAAATSYSVEHEEETYDFLTRLPATWFPVFAAKLTVQASSAVLLATALALAGRTFGEFPQADDAGGAFGMFGFAIVEVIAWGTLFSLLIRRPLLAALVTLVVGIVLAQLAVNVASNYTVARLRPEAHAEAIPLRLAIVLVVLAASAVVARGWLGVQARPGVHERFRISFKRIKVGAANRAMESDAIVARRSSTRVLAHLLWQTWRESWKLLLAPLGVALFLFFGIGAAVGVIPVVAGSRWEDFGSYLMASTALFVPTLYGAMAFYCDQRRGSFRFLAEHAGRPRFVWLARNIVWLGSLFCIWLLLMILAVVFIFVRMRFYGRDFVNEFFLWGREQSPGAPAIVYETVSTLTSILHVAGVGALGFLSAYGVGQFCSMAVRSEILAAFISLLLSAFVVAWVSVVYAWQLSAWLFVFPLFAGFMLATWLRAPDWIAGRNSLRAWTKPLAAVILPIMFIALFLPARRAAQINPMFGRDQRTQVAVEHAIADKVQAFQAENTAEARATAQMYITAAERLAAGVVLPDLLERWYQPKFLKTNELAAPGGAEIDPVKIPAAELPAYRAAKEKLDKIYRDARQATLDLAIAASKRPSCRFEFHYQPDLQTNQGSLYTPELWHSKVVAQNYSYSQLDMLLTSLTSEDSFERLQGALRMSAHLRSGQPADIFIDQLYREQTILRSVADWAGSKKRTKAELESALTELMIQFGRSPSLDDALISDHLAVRNVITGKDSPAIFSKKPIPLTDQLAFISNELPWERERALKSLDRITLRNVAEVESLSHDLSRDSPRELGVTPLRRWLRPQFGAVPLIWEIEEPVAATSYLASLEYAARVSFSELARAYCYNETCRRATLLQIALAMYRVDHKKYPSRLSDIVPKYLDSLPLDPFSKQPFVYESSGLDYPLEWSWVWQSGFHRLEPNTPVFWSVGPGDVRLKRLGHLTTQAADESVPEGISQQKSEPVYQLMSADDSWWWGDKALVFPLPK
jgi:hypothetical protein